MITTVSMLERITITPASATVNIGIEQTSCYLNHTHPPPFILSEAQGTEPEVTGRCTPFHHWKGMHGLQAYLRAGAACKKHQFLAVIQLVICPKTLFFCGCIGNGRT